MTPGDLSHRRFRRALGGFAAAEVNSLLQAIADHWEQTLHETEHLRLEVTRLEAVVHEQQRGVEAAAQAAQQLTGITAEANETAQSLIEDAQSRCDPIAAATEMRLHDMWSEIERLRVGRRDVAMTIERTIQALRTALGDIREQNTADPDPHWTGHPAAASADAATVAALQELDELSEDIIRSFGLTKGTTDGP